MISIEENDQIEIPATLPLLPVRDLVVFPFVIVPLFVGRETSVSAVEQALASHRMVMLAAQREVQIDDPRVEDLYRVGTVGMVMRMRRLSDGRLKVLVQGLVRARVDKFTETHAYLQGELTPIFDLPLKQISVQTEALMRSVQERLQHYNESSRTLGPDALVVLQGMKDPGRLADLVASNLPLSVQAAQEVLATPDPVKRLRLVADHLNREMELISTKTNIEVRARERMDKAQREYFLREQLKQIQSELGEGAGEDEYGEIAERITLSDMPDDVREEAEKQLARLSRMHPESSEAGTIRTYLDWLLDLRWRHATEDRLDLKEVKEVLDADHLGLDDAKDRVLEFLGVRKLNPANRGPILMLVGPPGVGKTSLGRSVARAMNREFVRISLGGVRDEAEIRGHRRTYVGALPGRIIQGMKQAGAVNPVFMLDEIDKVGRDFRGDPAAALLEVLDPEQNNSFVDHYLNLPYDLSRVMFITTANRVDTIPGPLLDRMEEIHLSGYSTEEKLEIAKQFLFPRQLARCGLGKGQLEISPEALQRMIERHTREAGLRQMERAIAQVCRKTARRVAEGEQEPCKVEPGDLRGYLGPPLHLPLEQLPQDSVGVANGLAWTPAGGEIIQVEVVALDGRGQLILTGQLGEVMKESAQAALSFARSHGAAVGLPEDFFSTHDVHVHVPAGAIPKDGPSAGLTMAVALISRLSGVPVRRDVAMTGEISLGGRLLPVGGVREKLLAALRAGLAEVVVPAQNREDIDSLPPEIQKRLAVVQAGEVGEVLGKVLVRSPFGSGCEAKDGRKTESKGALGPEVTRAPV
jgi:ATP-dependent Lon protease